MREWNKILADADDEYLTGLSNKGIVKRAHKDMETVVTKILSVEDEIGVIVGEETVKLCFPVGESKCSCPSRSICRHVVQAVLFCREKLTEDGGDGQGMQPSEHAGKTEGEAGEAETGPAEAQTAPDRTEVPGNEKLCQEIGKMPVQTLKRAMGARAFTEFAMQVQAGIEPEMTESSVITVRLPKQEAVVKLLSPLEYSSCTCHKKELCSHKAAAILWCQLKMGVLPKETLISRAGEPQQFDLPQMKDAAEQMKSFLEELYDTGLSRMPADAADGLERLAVLGHNAGLARFEGYFRGLADSCRKYEKRVSSFQIREMMRQTSYVYGQVLCLLDAKSGGEAAEYAGEFKAQYRPAGNLELTGIAAEHFESKTGYEGETVYFLEERKKEWYTYTSARPVFYETGKFRRSPRKAQAPWGLPLSLEDMATVRISLADARTDERKRLSSTQESRGEIAGPARLTVKLLKGWYYEDFETLFEEQIAVQKARPDPVFIQPSGIREGHFDQTQQKFVMKLVDAEGREIMLEVPYSKREESTIRYLERFSGKLFKKEGEDEEKMPCFFGKVFLKERRICMYPIAMVKICPKEEEDCAVQKQELFIEPQPAKAYLPKEDACEALKELLEEIEALMEEVYQSGFCAVFDSTLEAMARSAELTLQYGLESLSGMLQKLQNGLVMRRHQTGKDEDGMAKVYGTAIEYLYLCEKKLELDSARITMKTADRI